MLNAPPPMILAVALLTSLSINSVAGASERQRSSLVRPIYDTRIDTAIPLDSVTPPLIGPSLRYGVDTTMSPCLDFYQYVNGGWRAQTILGSREPQKPKKVEIFGDTYTRTKLRLQALLDSARSVATITTDPTLKALGTFYESCVVTDTLERNPVRVRRDTLPVRDSTRSEQCLQRTITTLGGALGQAFAQELLASNARRRMEQLIEALRTAIVARLNHNRWMTAEEKSLALHRLNQLHLRIGMPKEMDDYRGLTLSATDYAENKRTVKTFENQQWLKSIGGSHRDKWILSLLTPNAIYNPAEHTIEIPAVMFMPPFFDATGEDAVNFAGVGYVIAHEIFHSLTAQLNTLGSTTIKKQIEHFIIFNSSLGTLDDWTTDGVRTYGEDIADLGGVLAAYDAWQATIKTNKKRPAPMLDGFTPDQRFFIALGRIWRAKWRGISQNRDAHAAPFARLHAMVLQSPAFARAFGCKEGDPMVLTPDKRASIW